MKERLDTGSSYNNPVTAFMWICGGILPLIISLPTMYDNHYRMVNSKQNLEFIGGKENLDWIDATFFYDENIAGKIDYWWPKSQVEELKKEEGIKK